MSASPHRGVIAASLVFAVILWGGNNTGVKYLVQSWPPIWTGGTRFVCAGLLLLAVLRWTRWLEPYVPVSAQHKRRLWWPAATILALNVVAFNVAVQITAVSHVALYLGAAPVWALLWEGWSGLSRRDLLKRYAAAALALAGVVVLFWPTLRSGSSRIPGELLGLTSSVLWTAYGRQCRALSTELSGAVITGHTMWRAGLLLLPLGLWETSRQGLPVHASLILVQLYCIIAGGVVAYAIWNSALRHWKTSEVYLFNNLIPPSTMLWAWAVLGEPITPTFGIAMLLVISGVLIGQTNWQRLVGRFWVPEE